MADIEVTVRPTYIDVEVKGGVLLGSGGGADLSDDTPEAVGTADAGAATEAARSDHVHAHGSHTDGTHHGVANASRNGFVPASPASQYAVPMDDGAGAIAWSKVKPFMLAPDFSASLSGGGTVEVGATVATPAFTASYVDGPPTTATLTDNDGNAAQNVVSTPSSFASAYSFTKTANNASVTFTLAATKGVESDSAQASYAWRPRVYWGVGVDGLTTESHIEALANNALASSRSRSFTLAPGSGEHMYYAFPSSYGTPTFTVGGFEGGFDLVGTVSVTNANGVAQNYLLYKSTNANLGSTNVVVT